jgi:hypothetical protein
MPGMTWTVAEPERCGNRSSQMLNHMIEDYARHIGQADLLPECIDGATRE